ncbi:TPA: hypothetical protein ONC18_000448 [Enterobacter kobei]|nr:hypothetical protein [Enterobacter kobei]
MNVWIKKITCFTGRRPHLENVRPSEPVSDLRAAPEQAYERIICSQLLKGVSTLEVVRDALLKSSQDLRNEQQAIEELNSRNSSAKNSLENLVNLIETIGISVEQSTGSLTKFRASFEEIHKYINEIDQLSRQTNLIAVNSAIEAAHVGSKGAGFSVIAKEIKSLSDQVSHSASNISALTKSIENSANNVCTVVSNQQPVIENMNHDIHHIVESIIAQ